MKWVALVALLLTGTLWAEQPEVKDLFVQATVMGANWCSWVVNDGTNFYSMYTLRPQSTCPDPVDYHLKASLRGWQRGDGDDLGAWHMDVQIPDGRIITFAICPPDARFAACSFRLSAKAFMYCAPPDGSRFLAQIPFNKAVYFPPCFKHTDEGWSCIAVPPWNKTDPSPRNRHINILFQQDSVPVSSADAQPADTIDVTCGYPTPQDGPNVGR